MHREILTLVTRPYSVKNMRIRLVVIVRLSEYPLSSFCAADGVYLNCLCSFCCEPFPYLFGSTYAYYRYNICHFLKYPWFLFLHLKTFKHCYNCVIAGPWSNFWLLRKLLRGFRFFARSLSTLFSIVLIFFWRRRWRTFNNSWLSVAPCNWRSVSTRSYMLLYLAMPLSDHLMPLLACCCRLMRENVYLGICDTDHTLWLVCVSLWHHSSFIQMRTYWQLRLYFKMRTTGQRLSHMLWEYVWQSTTLPAKLTYHFCFQVYLCRPASGVVK